MKLEVASLVDSSATLFLSQLAQFGKNLQSPGNHNGRGRLRNKFLNAAGPHILSQISQIPMLTFAHDLNTILVEIIEISPKANPGRLTSEQEIIRWAGSDGI